MTDQNIEFDVFRLEEKIYKDYMKEQNPYREDKFLTFNSDKTWDELDGDWDGRMLTIPTKKQWLSSEGYRRGYLSGIEQMLNEKYGLV